MDFRHDGDNVRLVAWDEDGNEAELIIRMPYAEPRDPLMAREQVEKHLSSTGNTPFKATKISLPRRVGFFSISFLNGIKRQVLEKLASIRMENIRAKRRRSLPIAFHTLKNGWISMPML